jgi:hypothetical protein
VVGATVVVGAVVVGAAVVGTVVAGIVVVGAVVEGAPVVVDDPDVVEGIGGGAADVELPHAARVRPATPARRTARIRRTPKTYPDSRLPGPVRARHGGSCVSPVSVPSVTSKRAGHWVEWTFPCWPSTLHGPIDRWQDLAAQDGVGVGVPL